MNTYYLTWVNSAGQLTGLTISGVPETSALDLRDGLKRIAAVTGITLTRQDNIKVPL